MTQVGLTHVGMVCDDVGATRAQLESRGVEFLTTGIAEVAGLKTTWCHDPWGTVIILMEKRTSANPYWAQWMPRTEAPSFACPTRRTDGNFG